MSVLDNYRLWSQSSPKVQEIISPVIPWRSYNVLSKEEKQTMLLHFKRKGYFWGYSTSSTESFTGHTITKISSIEEGIVYALNSINELYKKECYARRTLEQRTIQNMYEDFENIFFNEDENIVYEVLSLYGMGIIAKSEEKRPYRNENESDKQYEDRLIENSYREFDEFNKIFNEIFDNYKINVLLTRTGFIPQQDQLIIEEIYEPVLKALSSHRWMKVNRELGDAFKAYGESTPDAYSECMTHCYSSIQALLQEIVGNNDKSIKEANKEASSLGLIPNDAFSAKSYTELLSTFEQLRKQHGDAHPKRAYANEKTARLMLNLTITYIQHCLPNSN